MVDVGKSDWRSLVDIDKLMRWMDARGLGSGPIEDPLILGGGTQNLLLRFERSGRAYVLRRPPSHPRVNSGDIMQREIRVLSALARTDVPHAALIAGCDDPTVIGSAFLLMDAVEGFNATAGLPELHAESSDMRYAMGLALADGAAVLGRVSLETLGLTTLGKVEGFLERQVSRWGAQLEGYNVYVGWPGPHALGNVTTVARWLEQNRPNSFQPGLMHGDYHIANVMYKLDGPGLAAIVDWELTTAGDPLLDLGWMLATWPDSEGNGVGIPSPQPWQGFPKAEALINRYATSTDRDLTNLRWYVVLACYKLGIILEGTFARACAGKAAHDAGQKLHNAGRLLLKRAEHWIEDPCLQL